ncbi:MAG: hypothetical protein LIP12_17840 [Clostridiales bacterium]|nr:hypothetical protein [Clostridiales bacterium]
MTKEDAIKRLEVIMEHSKSDLYHHEVKATDWEKYGKNRTYLSIVETKSGTTHYKKFDYGFIDNLTGEYHPGNKDINDNYTLRGFDF